MIVALYTNFKGNWNKSNKTKGAQKGGLAWMYYVSGCLVRFGI